MIFIKQIFQSEKILNTTLRQDPLYVIIYAFLKKLRVYLHKHSKYIKPWSNQAYYIFHIFYIMLILMEVLRVTLNSH